MTVLCKPTPVQVLPDVRKAGFTDLDEFQTGIQACVGQGQEQLSTFVRGTLFFTYSLWNVNTEKYPVRKMSCLRIN